MRKLFFILFCWLLIQQAYGQTATFNDLQVTIANTPSTLNGCVQDSIDVTVTNNGTTDYTDLDFSFAEDKITVLYDVLNETGITETPLSHTITVSTIPANGGQVAFKLPIRVNCNSVTLSDSESVNFVINLENGASNLSFTTSIQPNGR